MLSAAFWIGLNHLYRPLRKREPRYMPHTWLKVQARDPEWPPDGLQSLNHGWAERCNSSLWSFRYIFVSSCCNYIIFRSVFNESQSRLDEVGAAIPADAQRRQEQHHNPQRPWPVDLHSCQQTCAAVVVGLMRWLENCEFDAHPEILSSVAHLCARCLSVARFIEQVPLSA